MINTDCCRSYLQARQHRSLSHEVNNMMHVLFHLDMVSVLACGCSLEVFPRILWCLVPTGSPSRGGDVAIYVFDINQPSLPTPFYYVLVFMALSTVFYSINSPENSPLSRFVLLVLILRYWSFQLDMSL